MGTSVAIKKIMKPFSTPVLSKRTYRELKLLKHIQHENVRTSLVLSFLCSRTAQITMYPRHLNCQPITDKPPFSTDF